jgi:K+-transporting ATPase c subunit
MKNRLICVAMTSMFWLICGLAYYSHKISNQEWVLPNQASFMQINTHKLQATPASFEVNDATELDNLIAQQTR